MPRFHVVGAGLAGLAAAVRIAQRGGAVTLYEAAGQAGGRCRSFHDSKLDRRIDNGNHLILSGNHALAAYIRAIGATGRLDEVRPARFVFHDLAGDARWQMAPGRRPWSNFLPGRLPPGVSAVGAAIDILRLWRAGPGVRIDDCLDTSSRRFERLWGPLAVAALNTEAADGAARLLWAVVRETLLRGEAASRPLLAVDGLSPALVDPALTTLADLGAEIRLRTRLRRLVIEAGRIAGLDLGDEVAGLDEDERLILAVPETAARGLLPELGSAAESRAILNAHFVLDGSVRLPGDAPLVGVLGGTAEWIFRRGDVLSVTVSDANRYLGQADEALAATLWCDVARILGRAPGALPPYRLILEKRATAAQTPEWDLARPGTRTRYPNLFLAGDWTDTGVPETLEGAVRSGLRAADAALGSG